MATKKKVRGLIIKQEEFHFDQHPSMKTIPSVPVEIVNL